MMASDSISASLNLFACAPLLSKKATYLLHSMLLYICIFGCS